MYEGIYVLDIAYGSHKVQYYLNYYSGTVLEAK